jgi:glycosyltransferase involved in cell wall biosynthesis
MLISACIPVGPGRSPYIAVESLRSATLPPDTDLEFSIVHDKQGRGAPWARNQAFAQSRGQLILWSDDDIAWERDAILRLGFTLNRPYPAGAAPAYSYGAWQIVGGPRNGLIQGNRPFDGERLLLANYISTMSLMHRNDFLGFDESLARLQDWDLYARMFLAGHKGVYCGGLIFKTTADVDGGITSAGPESYRLARLKVLAKIEKARAAQ